MRPYGVAQKEEFEDDFLKDDLNEVSKEDDISDLLKYCQAKLAE